MQWLYDVHGDHPVLKRIDELQLTEVDKNDLVAELKRLSYENIEVNKDIYFEDGDEIDITSHMYQENKNEEAVRLLFNVLSNKANNLRIDGIYDWDKDPNKIEESHVYQLCPLRVTIKAIRVDRKTVSLQGEWEIGNGKTQITNIYGLRKMGFKFIGPENEEISLMNADDDILYEHELVVKYYALQNKLSAEEAQKEIDRVQSAMGHSGIIFYRP